MKSKCDYIIGEEFPDYCIAVLFCIQFLAKDITPVGKADNSRICHIVFNPISYGNTSSVKLNHKITLGQDISIMSNSPIKSHNQTFYFDRQHVR